MSTSPRRGRRLLLLALVVALAAGAAFAFLQGARATARVKAVNRDTAIDAVTGSVVVDAEGGFKELRSEAAGKVVTANLRPGTHFRKGDVLGQLDTTEPDT